MAHATKAMQAVGAAANLPEMQKNMQQFAKGAPGGGVTLWSRATRVR